MSKEDIDKAVKEAEQFAAEDAKRKEEVDIRNQGDQMVYQTEKVMEDLKDKLDANDKSTLDGRPGQAHGRPEGHRRGGHQGGH